MIVLDTHAFFWLANEPQRLSRRAAAVVEEDSERVISAVSAQEIAYLVARGRLTLDRPVDRWVYGAMATHSVSARGSNVTFSVSAGSLDPVAFPGDPADRLIYATALELDARIVSVDARLKAFDPERVIW